MKKGHVGRLAGILFTSPLFYVPLLIAVAVKVASSTPWEPTFVVLPLALIPIACGLACFELGVRWRAARSADLVRPGMVERELVAVVSSYVCFLAAEAVIVTALAWPVGVALLAAMLVWAAVWSPPPARRIVIQAAVTVRCTPQQAFAVISDPNRWAEYIPNYTLVNPVEVPLHVGSEFQISSRQHALGVDALERVVVFEPASRFGTELPEDPGRSTGVTELKPVEGGTEIVYTYRRTIRFASALIGGALRRKRIVGSMLENRTRINERLKQLLEGQHPGDL